MNKQKNALSTEELYTAETLEGVKVEGQPFIFKQFAYMATPITERQAHEESAGMNLEDSFFTSNRINPDSLAEFREIPINPETLKQIGGACFDRVNRLEKLVSDMTDIFDEITCQYDYEDAYDSASNGLDLYSEFEQEENKLRGDK